MHFLISYKGHVSFFLLSRPKRKDYNLLEDLILKFVNEDSFQYSGEIETIKNLKLIR